MKIGRTLSSWLCDDLCPYKQGIFGLGLPALLQVASLAFFIFQLSHQCLNHLATLTMPPSTEPSLHPPIHAGKEDVLSFVMITMILMG